jgi:hypothetical protein
MAAYASVGPRTSWLDDPHLARRFARVHWLVLVASFVLMTRFELDLGVRRIWVAAMIAVLVLLNAPVAFGLHNSRAEAHTRPFRMVAFALALRVAATMWVVWSLST